MGCHPTFPDISQAERAALMRSWERINALQEVCREAKRVEIRKRDRDRFPAFARKLDALERATVFAFPEIRHEPLPTAVVSPYGRRLELTDSDRPAEGCPPASIVRGALALARKIAAVCCHYPELDHDLEAFCP